ncbi:MAG: hypothetical protein CMM52_16555 [Rhodospirillaceae bacterium]|nr:hypothetical protein [Rhodospirillaceae bacterium]|tara:strand:+ start:25150 stop:26913 length:1764 start_codon:yes stop_codon:yes gene_type:complete
MIARILSILFRQYRWRTLAIISVLLLTGILSGLGVVALFPLVASLGSEVNSNPDGIVGLFHKAFSYFQIELSVLALILFIAFIFLIKAILTVYTDYLSMRIRVETEVNRKQKLFDTLLNSSLNNLYQSKFGEVANAIIRETGMIGQLVDYATRLLTGVIHLLVFIAVVLLVSWQLTLMTAALAFGIYFLARKIFKRAEKLGRSITSINGSVQEIVNYTLSGYRVVKSFVSESVSKTKMRENMSRYRRDTVELTVTESVLRSISEPLILFFVVMAYIFFEFEFGELVTFVVALSRMYGSVQTIQNTHYKIAQHVASLDVYEKIEADLIANQERPDGQLIFSGLKNEIALHNVSYSYSTDEDTFSLGPIDLRIPKGNMIALVGASGSGKSTCVDLIEGFIYPNSGSVNIDGTNLADYEARSFRRRIGYVSQDIFLINDTVTNNILFYRQGVDFNSVEKAAKYAHAHEFISALPEGYESLMGEQGTNLSGGQKQRIALARALLGDPDILILDEATSALDNEAEREVQNAIDSLSGSMTIIVIAHRLSTVRNADHIYVLDDGKVVEDGNFDALLAAKGRLYEMHNVAGTES